MKLYNVAYSGNSYKVRLLLAQLGLPCEIIEVDILKGESRTLEFKADMQNALNQTQYSSVSTNLSSVNFGQVTGTNGARIVQVQLRLAF